MNINRTKLKDMICLLKPEGANAFYENYISKNFCFSKHNTKNSELIHTDNALPSSLPGWIPTRSQLNSLALENFLSHTLEGLSAGIHHGEVSYLTFIFTGGILSPPSGSYPAHRECDVYKFKENPRVR